ncbi:MAG: ribulose-phosphate 3-epimerase [Atopobiaceae bacterium]|jgi:ribulose-phosphate 3-epimerase
MLEDVLISPSIHAASTLHLADELTSVRNADYIHCDVMDGVFVPNISFGQDTLKAVHAGTDLPLDVHLMVANIDQTIESYLATGPEIVSFHIEAATHPHRIVSEIHAQGAKAGIVLNPGTPVAALDALIEDLDMVLVMSVDPGFSGQKFIESTYKKLDELVALCAAHHVSPLIEVDGGVGELNAEALVSHGARMLVAGSAVFGSNDRAGMVEAIRRAGRLGITARA